ncbi:fasciclin domain-containing protein [Flavihumibacter stibioxidans]|uniref:FAS1 domain-containing protein n=1 Tax=Flavihumibacter stibioxidans TaxID=1834163 RepID=A0ABR7M476_9BACT|nr:hypothetical protein [Flavihumibacter stibioxidans]
MKNINKLYNGRSLKVVAIAAILSIVVTGCVKENFKYQYSAPNDKLGINAWEYIQQKDSLSLMEEAVTAAGLQQYYSGTTEYTFIVPRNSAFRSLFKAKKYEGISSIPVDSLRTMLAYHIVKAKVLFSDPALLPKDNPIAYETENGQTMYLSHNSSYQGLINQGTKKVWTIITSNLQPTNGVIHVTADIVYLAK